MVHLPLDVVPPYEVEFTNLSEYNSSQFSEFRMSLLLFCDQSSGDGWMHLKGENVSNNLIVKLASHLVHPLEAFTPRIIALKILHKSLHFTCSCYHGSGDSWCPGNKLYGNHLLILIHWEGKPSRLASIKFNTFASTFPPIEEAAAVI